VIRQRGFSGTFKHALGHGVGFAAIDHDAHPRIHPKSTEVLEPGMVFNIEPAIYLDGITGMRHCDVVALTDSGPQVLTPFQAEVEALVLAGA
jgi:Xaa-Pro dipeptidase